MKTNWILIPGLMICGVTNALAATPSTSCPLYYAAHQETAMIIAEEACPTGYVKITPASITGSCLETPHNMVCLMYAPADTTYTDDTGHSYEFTQACPLE